MTNDLIHQLPADEQPVASKLSSVAEEMQLSPSFQSDLETQLMEKARMLSQPASGWFTKIMPAIGWAVLVVGAIALLNWTIRSMAPALPPAAAETSLPAASFETRVRQGDLCTGPLAVGHGFVVSITDADKTGFVPLDKENTMEEMRSFDWSPDGTRLAVLGNTTGQGKIHIFDLAGGPVTHLLTSSDLGYLMEAGWSRDGKQFAAWSGPNNRVLAVIHTDGTPPLKVNLDIQMFGSIQFSPDGESIVVQGGDASTAGLFEVRLDGAQSRLISAQVEDGSAYAWSADGARLAYIEMDRELGEARLVSQEGTAGSRAVLATLPIPKGSGSSIPDAAHLSWSADGELLVFEFGRGAADRAVYIAYTDGSGLVKAVNSGHAPAISPDGKCLAYISRSQVFLMDLTGLSPTSPPGTPILLADLPPGRAVADFRLDKLQWRP
jgi:Tol biopolymer transport system component